MTRNFWKERPEAPVILAWMTAGALTFAFLAVAGYGLFRLVTSLTG